MSEARLTQVNLPYGDSALSFRVDARNLIGVFVPHDLPPLGDLAAETSIALANPSGGPALAELARGARRVIIVADDNTRPTPTDVIIPILLDALNAAGVPDDAIEILVALGTHRKMTAEELEVKFGAQVLRRVAVLNHEAFDPAALIDLGGTPGGVPVQVNRRLHDADMVLGVGSIVPHHIPGFSGGAKIIQPGVCGELTTGHVHLLSVRQGSQLGILENQVRHEMEVIAERSGLKAILNTVLDRHGRAVGIVFGDPRVAFRRGVELSRRVYGVSVPRLADIVIAGSHPCDIEFWQAHKTLYAAELCVRPGGDIIIVTPCPEGVSATHADLLKFAGQSRQGIDAAIRAGKIHDLTAGALALAWACTRERARVCLMSEGISAAEAAALGFGHAASIEEALAQARQRHGADSSITVLPYAPDTLPILAC
jgi:nickel-dependent lactate racemase